MLNQGWDIIDLCWHYIATKGMKAKVSSKQRGKGACILVADTYGSVGSCVLSVQLKSGGEKEGKKKGEAGCSEEREINLIIVKDI